MTESKLRYIKLLPEELILKCELNITVFQFEMAVEKGQYNILSHPVMQELIRQKWIRCVRWSFYTLFLLYILFVLSWSMLIAYPSAQEKHKYVFPRDIWRILLIVRCTEVPFIATFVHCHADCRFLRLGPLSIKL